MDTGVAQGLYTGINSGLYTGVYQGVDIGVDCGFKSSQYGLHNIIKNGLKIYLDSYDINSNVRSGTTWYDLSGNGYNASLNNGAFFNSSDSYSVSIDGVNDTVSIGYSGNTSNTYTFIIIAKSNSMTSNRTNRQNLFGLIKTGGFTYEVLDYEIWGNDRLNSFKGDGTNYGQTTSQNSCNTLKANMFSVINNANSNTMYINDKMLSIGYQPYSSTFNSILIGSRNATTPNNIMNGNIYAFMAYDRELTYSEIKCIYLYTKQRFGL